MTKCSIALFCCMIIISGCARVEIQRSVDKNIFYSSDEPKLGIEVIQDYQYIGQVDLSAKNLEKLGARSLSVKKSSYLFGKIEDNNTLTSGIMIRIEKMQKGSWQNELFTDIKNKLIVDEVQFGFKTYEHFIGVSSAIFTEEEMNLIVNEGNPPKEENIEILSFEKKDEIRLKKGYTIPKCFMIQGFGRRAGSRGDVKVSIFYFEDITYISDAYSCKEWQTEENPIQDRDTLIDGFLNRGNNNFKILVDASE